MKTSRRKAGADDGALTTGTPVDEIEVALRVVRLDSIIREAEAAELSGEVATGEHLQRTVERSVLVLTHDVHYACVRAGDGRRRGAVDDDYALNLCDDREAWVECESSYESYSHDLYSSLCGSAA